MEFYFLIKVGVEAGPASGPAPALVQARDKISCHHCPRCVTVSDCREIISSSFLLFFLDSDQPRDYGQVSGASGQKRAGSGVPG